MRLGLEGAVLQCPLCFGRMLLLKLSVLWLRQESDWSSESASSTHCLCHHLSHHHHHTTNPTWNWILHLLCTSALHILPYLAFTFLVWISGSHFSYLLYRQIHQGSEYELGNLTQVYTSGNCQTLIYTQVSLVFNSNFFP